MPDQFGKTRTPSWGFFPFRLIPDFAVGESLAKCVDVVRLKGELRSIGEFRINVDGVDVHAQVEAPDEFGGVLRTKLGFQFIPVLMEHAYHEFIAESLPIGISVPVPASPLAARSLKAGFLARMDRGVP